MLLTLKRLKDEDQTATTGDLWTEDDKHWFTLEPAPPVVPTGLYDLSITPSPKFTRVARDNPDSALRKMSCYDPKTGIVRMPLVMGVWGHTGIRIHPGNFPHDTEGCILLGRVLSGDSVLESDPAFEDFFRWLDAITEPVYIDIGWTA